MNTIAYLGVFRNRDYDANVPSNRRRGNSKYRKKLCISIRDKYLKSCSYTITIKDINQVKDKRRKIQ